jgi:hypothetical protein
MKNEFYTYAYLRKDGTPYYIGKGKGKRAFRRQRGERRPPSQDRILILKKNLTEEEAFRHERYMIFVFGRKDLGTGMLYNLTEGGEGASGLTRNPESYSFTQTEAYREKMRKVMKRSGRVREFQPIAINQMKKAVRGVTPEGETFYFESLTEAQNQTGIRRQTISECCYGHRPSAGGWEWSYQD